MLHKTRRSDIFEEDPYLLESQSTLYSQPLFPALEEQGVALPKIMESSDEKSPVDEKSPNDEESPGDEEFFVKACKRKRKLKAKKKEKKVDLTRLLSIEKICAKIEILKQKSQEIEATREKHRLNSEGDSAEQKRKHGNVLSARQHRVKNKLDELNMQLEIRQLKESNQVQKAQIVQLLEQNAQLLEHNAQLLEQNGQKNKAIEKLFEKITTFEPCLSRSVELAINVARMPARQFVVHFDTFKAEFNESESVSSSTLSEHTPTEAKKISK